MSRSKTINYPHQPKRRHDVPICPDWHLYERLKAQIPRTLDHGEYSRRLRQTAAVLKVKPQTLRAALCRDGHYMGLRPSKLPNRFLLWDASSVEALLNGEVA